MRLAVRLNSDPQVRKDSALHTRRAPIEVVEPCKPGARALRRPIFAADPAIVSELVEQREQIEEIDLADIRLVPPGHARDLDMADLRQPSLQFRSEIPLDDLRAYR